MRNHSLHGWSSWARGWQPGPPTETAWAHQGDDHEEAFSTAAAPASAAHQQDDFNGDGYVKKAGYLVVYPGDAKGVTGADTKVIGQSTANVPGVDEKGDAFGGEVHVASAVKGVPATLAVAAPGENIGQGGVWLFKGSRSGPVVKGSVSFGEASLGVKPSPVRFGSQLG